MPTIAEILARELDKPLAHVQNVIDLLDQGNTIPFIARYRKELHGSMDDTALRTLEDRLNYLRNLDQRRQEVKNAIDGQGKLTDELSAAIDTAATLAEVEDLYRPYKQKRRTRATVAREKGLEPLALLLLDQGRDCPAPEEAARDYVDPEKGVETLADALQGANDIVAELLSDDAAIRKTLRELLRPVHPAVRRGLGSGYPVRDALHPVRGGDGAPVAAGDYFVNKREQFEKMKENPLQNGERHSIILP